MTINGTMIATEPLRIGLDIDGVLANFSEAIIKEAALRGLEQHFPKTAKDVSFWDMTEDKQVWSNLFGSVKQMPEFWLSLPSLIAHKDLDFEPVVYCTARPIESAISEQWLTNHGFPNAEVITVNNPAKKEEELLKRGVEVFIDDYWLTISEMHERGNIFAILAEAPYQIGYAEECLHLPKIKELKYQSILGLYNKYKGARHNPYV